MVTRRELDHGLEELRRLLVEMGGRVGTALMDAMGSLVRQDAEAATCVIMDDPALNALEQRVTELGARLIAAQQPVAGDLRNILAALKISGDLERMGDLAVDIAKAALRLEAQPYAPPLLELPKLAEMVKAMIGSAVRAYLEQNVDLAYKLDRDDHEVDALYSRFLTDMFQKMVREPETMGQSMLLSFVGRYIERIGDHATNIGESTVYLVTGRRPDLNT